LSKAKKVGEIRIISSPTFISKQNKYVVEMRAFEPIERLEYYSFEVFSSFADIVEYKKIKRPSGKIGKIIEHFDKKEGLTFYHYVFYASLPVENKYESEDIADALKGHLEINENCRIQSVFAKRVKLFPWEKDKIVKRIPLTEKMFEKFIEKIKKQNPKK